MHLFGFSKKAKKRLSSGHLSLGLRKCKSTGNIHSSDTDRDDSSIGSSYGSGSDDDIESKTHHTKQYTRRKSLDAGMEQQNRQDRKLKVTESAPSTEAKKSILTINHPTSPTKNDNGLVLDSQQGDHFITPPPPPPPPSVSIQHANPPNLDEQQQQQQKHNHNGVDPNDLNALLLMESQQRLAQSEQNKAEAEAAAAAAVPPRPTRLTFELPVTPSRSRSPSNQPYPRARPYRSVSEEGTRNRNLETGKSGRRKRRHRRWSRLMGGSDTDEDSSSEQAEKARAKRHLEIGTYVTLIKRPLPTMGHVRYIGPIEGEPGEWIGVELEHRVGNCDGSIKGQRFFKTDPQRGIFLKRFDVEAVI